MSDTMEKQILNELSQIRRLLTVLSQDKLKEFNNYIESEFLSTDQRKQMYELFDGNLSFAEIAKEVGVTSRGVSKFAAILEKANLLEFITTDTKLKLPKRLF